MAAALDGGARALELRGLRVGYGSTVVLDDVSVVIRPGELVGLVGDNGAGKTTLVKAIAGELAMQAGSILPRDRDVAVVWQDVELVESLSIAENLVLGREGRRLVSPRRTHVAAREVLARLALDIDDLSRPLRTLSGGQRRLVAIARQVARDPDFLLLDEPTASLGAPESQAVMALVARIRERGVGVLLVSHDLGLVADASDRVVVLHQGRVVATVDGGTVGPEELGELIVAGASQESSRRQLARFASLVEQVAAIDEGSGVTAITTACSVALGAVPVAALVGESTEALRLLSAQGLDLVAQARLEQVVTSAEGPIAEAFSLGAAREGGFDLNGERRHLWAVPMLGPRGALGVLAVIAPRPLGHDRARSQLASLYAATIATTIERERALHALEQRNHVLEVLQRFLEVLAGGARVEPALDAALAVLREGLGAVELELVEGPALVEARADRAPRTLVRGIELDGAEATALVAKLTEHASLSEAAELLSAAASSVRLALERRRVEQAEREAAALRRSQALQVAFVQRLSHELRTPLTAITGYASSLLAEDVRWDTESERRFLQRIVTESQRLARLVGDLLDLSAIESGTLRVRRDWAEVGYIVEAAIACVPEVVVDVDLHEDVPPVFVDHDRIEQVLVNLLHNAAYHNPPGTRVRVTARRDGGGEVVIAVEDNGAPLPAGVGVEELAQRHREGPGSGLGLAISSSIVAAHGGVLRLVPRDVGKRFEVVLPEADESAADVAFGMERT